MSIFRKNNSTLIQLHFDGTCSGDSGEVAEDFAEHFCATCSYTSLPLSSIPAFCSDILPLVPVSDVGNQKAVNRHRPTKSAGLDDVHGFINKGY